MDYGRKDFFVDPGLGFRDSVSPSWFDGWKANFAYNHMPLTRFIDEQNKFSERQFDPTFTPDKFVARLKELPPEYAVHYDELARAKDNDHFDFIRDAIAEELTYKDRAANAPISAQFAAGITDLVNLGFLIPGVGQVRAAKTGLDAIKTAGKFGLGAGLVSEARRAPFAYADSDYEAAANVAMTTMFSGIFGGTFHYGKPFVQSTARKVVDFANGRSHKHIFKNDGSVNLGQQRFEPPETNVNIVTGSVGKTVNGRYIPAFYRQKENTIYLDEDYIKGEMFNAQAWKTPKVKGVRPIDYEFESPDEWFNFVLTHEILHQRNPAQSLGINTTKAGGKAQYENVINDLALDHIQKNKGVYSKTPLNETDIYDGNVNNPLGSPTQKILNNPKIPQTVKRLFYLMNNNSSVGVKGNVTGAVAEQSVHQRIAPSLGTSYKLFGRLRDLHAGHVNGFADAKAPSFMGAYSPFTKEYEGFLEDIINRKILIDSGVPEKVRLATEGITDQQRLAIKEIDDILKAVDEDARYHGVLGNDAEVKQKLALAEARIKSKQDLIDEIISKDTTQRKAGLSKAQSKKIDDLTNEVDSLKVKVKSYRTILKFPTRSDFSFPIYYNKQLLMSDDNARESLTTIFEKHYTRERAQFGEEGYTTTPREDAERTIARILQEDGDDLESPQADFAGGAKHVRARKTNIPVHEIQDYILKNEEVFVSYLDRMNKRIAFADIYGGRNIDDVLNDADLELRKAGFTAKQIGPIRASLYGEYERTMGTVNRRPDRLDNQAVLAMKGLTGPTYLGMAGISAITDVGSVVMAHGAQKVVAAGWAAAVDMGYTSQIAKNLRFAGEAYDLARNAMTREMISDTTRRIQPNLLERTVGVSNKVFYTLNGLAPITLAGKTIDSFIVQDKFVQLSMKAAKGKLAPRDAEFLNRYGVTQEMAEYVAKMPVQKHPSYNFYYSNTDNWPVDTAQGRAALRQYQTAIAAHSNNTIIMATSFDKPQIVDGLLYMRDNAFFQQMRKRFPNSFVIDKRASTVGQDMVRMDSQVLTVPFTFMNFAFGANNKIINVIRDPVRANKLQGVSALLALSYLSLELKDQSWWRGAGSIETMARVVDHSGLVGIYGDLAYMGLASAVNTGLVNESDLPIPPKYIDPDPNRRMTDAITEPFGAPVGYATDVVRVFGDYMKGNYKTAHDDMFYVLPYMGLPFLRDDARDLWNAGR